MRPHETAVQPFHAAKKIQEESKKIMNASIPTIPINRLGVCSWSLRPVDAAELVTAVQRLGLSKIQLALGPVIESPDAFGDVLARLDDAGIKVASGMLEAVGEDYSTLETIKSTGGVRPDEHWPATRDRAERVADLAGHHGIELVTLHAGFIPHHVDDPTRSLVLERLRTLADVFAERNVRVGLETGQESATTLLEALHALDHPSVGVNFDPANMILYDMGDPVEAIRMLATHVVQVHAKDAIKTSEPGTWGSEVPVGSGQVDWNAFIAEVESMGRPVDVVIEREAGEDRENDILVAKRRLRGS
jgi:L-ribulose-5-phosphate 3-epimerase